MSIPNELIKKHPGLGDWAILHAYRGSIAHGLYVPSSDPNSTADKDTMAICVPPLEYYFGLKEYGSRDTKEIKSGEWDIVIYTLQKFIKLLSKGNPNVLTLLWLDSEHYIKIKAAGQLLIDQRELFIGKHVYHSFTGYAYSQLKRMERHNFHGYMGEKRKRLVTQHGYDTKNAAHLIRLLRMGIEFIKDGDLQVTRPDAQELLHIKRGGWSLEQVKTEAQRLFEEAEQVYQDSKLPAQPDHEAVNQLLLDATRLELSERGEI
ncbi:MAG: nucleotidyltransferase domain-containing protein [Ardenticatenaceae bacterium]